MVYTLGVVIVKSFYSFIIEDRGSGLVVLLGCREAIRNYLTGFGPLWLPVFITG